MSDRRQSEHDGRVAVEQDRIETGPVGIPISTRLTVIEMKLDTGVKTFGELRDVDKETAAKIATLEAKLTQKFEDLEADMMEKTTPKPVDWSKMAMGGFGILVTILAAWWTMSALFNDRPTRGELKDSTDEQRKATQDQAVDLRELRDKQTEQRVILDGVREEVRDTSRKLDILIQNDRAAAPRGR